MLIKYLLYPSGYVECQNDKCPFNRECANHETAGDFRSEDGFSPELYRIDGSSEIACKTAEQPIDEEIEYAIFPANYDSLGRGLVCL